MLVAYNTEINHNIAGDKGGGFYADRSLTKLEQVHIKSNEAMKGGGVCLENEIRHYPAQCQDCESFSGIEHEWYATQLTGNTAHQHGGGVYLDCNGSMISRNLLDLKMLDCDFLQNEADTNGGAIYVQKTCLLWCKDANISQNHALNGSGGGIYNDCFWDSAAAGPSTPEHCLEQVLITGNQASNFGGGIYTKQTFFVISSTIAENACGLQSECGGGIACFSFIDNSNADSVRPVFFNTIIYANVELMSNPEQIYLDNWDCKPQFGFCDIERYSLPGHDFTGAGAPYWMDYGWIPSNPPVYDVNPSLNWDYSLPNGSFCRNKGSESLSYCLGWPNFQSFNAFPWSLDFTSNPRICEDTIDLGAFEVCTKLLFLKVPDSDGNLKNLSARINPNPVGSNQQLEIILSSRVTGEITVKLTDLTGKLISNTTCIGEEPAFLLDSHFFQKVSSGTYILHLNFFSDVGEACHLTCKLVFLDF